MMNKIPYLLCAVLFLVGCSDEDKEITTYEIPKEKQEEAVPMPARMPTPAGGGDMQVMPGMAEDVQNVDKPLWIAPATWQEQPLGSMRKGSWTVEGAEGEAEISVTAFPGDVGGLQMNVQRWAGQVGLPASAAQTQAIELPAGPATLVRIADDAAPNSLLAAIIEQGGYSWFFKMMGPDGTVRDNRGSFMEFLNTVNFPADQ